jgi:WD40 repeat protein
MPIFMLILLQASFALSQIPDQPFQRLTVGSSIKQIAFSPDGDLLAIACEEGLYLCDTLTLDESRLFKSGNIESVAFSPDGRMLAAGANWRNGLPDDWEDDPRWREDWQEIIYLWDLQNEKQTELEIEPDSVQSVLSVCFSPDSQTLVSGDADGIRFWNVENKVEIGQLPLWAFGQAYSLAYRRDGNMLAVGTYNTIHLVDPKELKILSSFEHYDGLNPEAWILCIGFTPDGTILASGSGDNAVCLWNVSSLKRIERLNHNGDVYFLSFTSDGKQIVYGGWGKIIRVYDMITKETVYWEDIYPISSGALSPDGNTLAVAGFDGVISFWKMPEYTTDVRLKNQKPFLWGMIKEW